MKPETLALLADLARLMGPVELERFLADWGGRSLYLPKPKRLRDQTRDAEIRAERRADPNLSYAELGRRHGRLCERQVRRIVEGERDPEAA